MITFIYYLLDNNYTYFQFLQAKYLLNLSREAIIRREDSRGSRDSDREVSSMTPECWSAADEDQVWRTPTISRSLLNSEYISWFLHSTSLLRHWQIFVILGPLIQKTWGAETSLRQEERAETSLRQEERAETPLRQEERAGKELWRKTPDGAHPFIYQRCFEARLS